MNSEETKSKCCKTCKHSFVAFGVVDSESKKPPLYTCRYKNETVDEKDKCWRYVKRGSLSDNIEQHLNKNWKFWVGIIVVLLVGIIGVLI